MKNHLEPLGKAANATQNQHCRLDDVLLTFGSLYLQFFRQTDPEDTLIRTAVLDSLNKRWSKTEQEVFVAAVVLNPMMRRPSNNIYFWHV